ncbi:uncharacterized protein QC763_707955 [Podospora pseudopauciseta]|uniref:Uncharacterized protein n=2 Tax=Podospora TaxID=5144 RepID=A0ABR0H1B9_9PEZI|nr:hypothetical protein QC763_707955 [Podospora pseudopauciseta]KAK4668506.1 hypothetical protein QC764_707955 [Podospora pseudoanserina]
MTIELIFSTFIYGAPVTAKLLLLPPPPPPLPPPPTPILGLNPPVLQGEANPRDLQLRLRLGPNHTTSLRIPTPVLIPPTVKPMLLLTGKTTPSGGIQSNLLIPRRPPLLLLPPRRGGTHHHRPPMRRDLPPQLHQLVLHRLCKILACLSDAVEQRRFLVPVCG